MRWYCSSHHRADDPAETFISAGVFTFIFRPQWRSGTILVQHLFVLCSLYVVSYTLCFISFVLRGGTRRFLYIYIYKHRSWFRCVALLHIHFSVSRQLTLEFKTTAFVWLRINQQRGRGAEGRESRMTAVNRWSLSVCEECLCLCVFVFVFVCGCTASRDMISQRSHPLSKLITW